MKTMPTLQSQQCIYMLTVTNMSKQLSKLNHTNVEFNELHKGYSKQQVLPRINIIHGRSLDFTVCAHIIQKSFQFLTCTAYFCYKQLLFISCDFCDLKVSTCHYIIDEAQVYKIRCRLTVALVSLGQINDVQQHAWLVACFIV